MITKEQVGELLRCETGCWPVVSFYLHVDGRDRSLLQCTEQTQQMFRSARSVIQELDLTIAAHSAILNDFERINQSIKADWAVGENKGVAIFASSAAGMWRTYPLPCRVRDSIHIASSPCIRPLASLLSHHLRSGVVVINRAETRLFRFHGGELQSFGVIEDPEYQAHQESRAHMQSGPCARILAEAQMLEYLTRVEEALTKMIERARLKRLVVLGTADILVLFLSLLPKSLSENTIGSEEREPQDMQETEIIERVESILARVEQHNNEDLVRDIHKAASPDGLAVMGMEETLLALSSRVVRTLVIDSDLKAVGYVCQRCRFIFTTFGACPQCGQMKPTVLEDVVEAAVGGAIRQGVKVRFVSSNKAWTESGGIGGLLSFRPPRAINVNS